MIGALVVVGIMTMAVVLFIWPNYREAKVVRTHVADLEARANTLESRALAVDHLAAEVDLARTRMANDLKVIPESADVAGLIRKLSDTIDGVNVVDQTFTAGTAGVAIVGVESPARATPVAADMRATFESIFALLRKAESMDRLVRIASVRLLCKRDEPNQGSSDVPVLTASVSLEVVYEPLEPHDEAER
jgi:hypothetical protein